jgi:UDP-N-acetylenolpyruvoylglucosamine reductase
LNTDSDGRPRAGAAWLLEQAGCRAGQPPSAAVPGVRCSPHRTLTLTAHGAVTAADFVTVLDQLRDRVSETSGIVLEQEPARVGDWTGHF